MRSCWSRMDLKSSKTCVFIKRGENTERYTDEKGPCDDGGRDWGNAGVSQGITGIAGIMRRKKQGRTFP